MEKCLPKFLQIKSITDYGLWDQFWQTRSPNALFQSWSWGEVIERQRIPVWRLGLFEDGSLVGILQVVKVTGRRGTYLHIRHGPIFVSQSKSYWQAVITHLEKLARDEHAWFLRLSPKIGTSPAIGKLFDSLRLFPSVVHEVDAQRCLLLPLDQSEDALLSGMRKTTRYEIRRAEKLGVRVVSTTDPAELDKFFYLYRKTSMRQHFVIHSGLREEFDVFSKEGNAVLLLGYYKSELFSGALILFSGNQAIYHHGASIPSKFSVNYAIQWEAIRMAKKRGKACYNFWGVSPEGNPSHPWHGHSLFKRGFGGWEEVTMHTQDYPVSALYWMTRLVEWWQERLRGY